MLDTDTKYTAAEFVTTYTGGQFFPLKPRLEDVNVIDIAHHLSGQSRFGGAGSIGEADVIYSTAQHCCLLCDYVKQKGGSAMDCYQILHHDDAEAYLVDMPRPVKQHMPEFKKWDHDIQMVVRLWLGLANEPIPSWQDEYDSRIIMDERAQCLADQWRDWNHNVEPLGVLIEPWSPRTAEQNFLLRHATYSREIFGVHQYLRSGWKIPTHSVFKEYPFKTGGSDVMQTGPDPRVITDLQEVDLRGGVGRVAMRSEDGMMVRDTRAGKFPRPAWEWIRGSFQLATEGVQEMKLVATVQK
jgi:hypothetical protein